VVPCDFGAVDIGGKCGQEIAYLGLDKNLETDDSARTLGARPEGEGAPTEDDVVTLCNSRVDFGLRD
jgi:hypothetical protein